MSRYASETEVTSDKSKADIERTLMRYGADQFFYGTSGDMAVLGFRIEDRQIKMLIPLPALKDFARTPGRGIVRSVASQHAEWDQACRSRWRAVLLIIKAKLEAVDCQISTIEREFLADVVLPDGQTVGNWALPQIEASYATGQMPSLMPGVLPRIEGPR